MLVGSDHQLRSSNSSESFLVRGNIVSYIDREGGL